MSIPEQFEFDDEIYSLEPQEDLPAQSRTPVLVQGVPCKQCGYDLSGLAEDGVCPECGFSIELSLAEDLLEYSAPAYLKSLHLGVNLILLALTIKFLSFIAALGFAFVASMINGNPDALDSIISIVDLMAAVLTAIGWWMFTAPDPMYTGRTDGSTSRKVVRVTTLINVCVAVSMVPFQFLILSSPSSLMIWTIITLSIASVLAWIVGYFAGMQYLRWLAPRFPDMRIYNRAGMFLWLGPLLFTFGWICVGLGPLIGFVLYWFLLNWVRENLKSIRRHQESRPNTIAPIQ